MRAQRRLVAFRMALAHKDRQVRHQQGQAPVLAQRPGTDGAGHPAQHLLGSRFHGNVIAVTSGIPALTMVVDSRMDEMTRLFRLPTLPMEDFRLDKPLEYYYDLADYTDFNKAYPERMRVFRDFLQRNGLAEAAGG